MTELQYLLFARLFEAHFELHAAGEYQSTSYSGDVCGLALRRWASARGLAVESEMLSSAAVGGSWTVLRAKLSRGWDISVHLETVAPLPPQQPTAPAEPVAELEIPF